MSVQNIHFFEGESGLNNHEKEKKMGSNLESLHVQNQPFSIHPLPLKGYILHTLLNVDNYG